MSEYTDTATGAHLVLALFPQAHSMRLRVAPGSLNPVSVTILAVRDARGNHLFDATRDGALADELVPAEDYLAAAIEDGDRFAEDPADADRVLLARLIAPADATAAVAELLIARAAVAATRERVGALGPAEYRTTSHAAATDACVAARQREAAAEREVARSNGQAAALLPQRHDPSDAGAEVAQATRLAEIVLGLAESYGARRVLVRAVRDGAAQLDGVAAVLGAGLAALVRAGAVTVVVYANAVLVTDSAGDQVDCLRDTFTIDQVAALLRLPAELIEDDRGTLVRFPVCAPGDPF